MEVDCNNLVFPPWDRLVWQGDDRFMLGDLEFRLVSWGSPKMTSSGKTLILVKDQPFAASMSRLLRNLQPKRIVEFGIYQGASLVLLDKLYQPDVLIGFDERSSAPALDDYVANGLSLATLVPCYETLQDDAAAILRVLERHGCTQGLDLVIDDCSHLYEQSKRSFEIAFPLLSPGGIYLIEDWGWAHWSGAFQEKTFFKGTPLSLLLFELLILQASRPELIARIEIDFHHAAIVRGHETIEPETFQINASLLNTTPMNIPRR